MSGKNNPGVLPANDRDQPLSLKLIFLESRPQFLILALVLAFLGTSIALFEGSFNPLYAVLAAIGLVLAHASVNIINDYFDYRSGIDLKTKRTPFSGGSGLLPENRMSSRQALRLGLICLGTAALIGLYFCIAVGWELLPLLLVAAFCVLAYSPIILKLPWPEWAPGIGLGVLPVMGAYFVQTGSYTLNTLFVSIPSGLLVHNLLLLNEFPDIEADKHGGRKTLPITIGPRKASYVYSVLLLFTFLWIAICLGMGIMPAFCGLVLLLIPLVGKTARDSLKYVYHDKLETAMKNNVIIVLVTQFLIGAGYVLAAIF